jgi:hypothetical protein
MTDKSYTGIIHQRRPDTSYQPDVKPEPVDET